MKQTVQEQADNLVALANLGRLVADAVRESGLLKVKKRGGKKRGRKPGSKNKVKEVVKEKPVTKKVKVKKVAPPPADTFDRDED